MPEEQEIMNADGLVEDLARQMGEKSAELAYWRSHAQALEQQVIYQEVIIKSLSAGVEASIEADVEGEESPLKG